MNIVVVGAGAFGGWTALELARRGAAVRVVDAWGPGNFRASSGGETRVIRATYGSHEVYTGMAVRALKLWRAHEDRFREGLFRITGALWMFAEDLPFVGMSTTALRAHGLALEPLTVAAAQKRYPQIDFTGIASALLEPDAGYIFARRACDHVAARVVAEGGSIVREAVRVPVAVDGELRAVVLADGSRVEADAFVFAGGPWLGSMFPDVLGDLVSPTRQEVYYFATPPDSRSFTDDRLPVWIDLGDHIIYGIPGGKGVGFKVADDTPGPPIDPTTDPRVATQAGIERMRAFLARRFPALAKAPLLRAEVCQYESTPDANFIIDRHPRAANVWLVGGGSGHGFKMGPVIGERVASLVLGEAPVDSTFELARFASPPVGGWRPKWS